MFLEDRPRGSACAFFVACVIVGLEHLHERCIVHRDVKPENVMLDEPLERMRKGGPLEEADMVLGNSHWT